MNSREFLRTRVFYTGDNVDTLDVFNSIVIRCRSQLNDKLEIPVFFSMGGSNFEFVPVETDTYRVDNCRQVEISAPAEPYAANRFPITVPTTYFQGTWDGATFAGAAMRHWRSVPQGKRQLLIGVKGGHSANVEIMLDKSNPEAQTIQKTVFEKALAGEFATKEEVTKMNDTQKSVKWLQVVKDSNSKVSKTKTSK